MPRPLSPELRALVRQVVSQEWPGFDPLLLEAQVLAESGGRSDAVSPAGARGLLQIMPDTARSLGMDPNLLFNPELNLRLGLRYLRRQYDKMAEIPDPHERLRFALAAYNCGRGWINLAVKLALKDCGATGLSEPGEWQRWAVAGPYLEHRDCRDTAGNNPDGRAAMLYVARIAAFHDRLNRTSGGG